jgi:hypothetical protein
MAFSVSDYQDLLPVEVSVVIDQHDIDRAAERARILRDVGYENTMPLVVDSLISGEASDYARERGVAVQIDRDSRLAALAN